MWPWRKKPVPPDSSWEIKPDPRLDPYRRGAARVTDADGRHVGDLCTRVNKWALKGYPPVELPEWLLSYADPTATAGGSGYVDDVTRRDELDADLADWASGHWLFMGHVLNVAWLHGSEADQVWDALGWDDLQ